MGCAYSLSCLKIVKRETEVRHGLPHPHDKGEVEGSAVLVHTDKGDHGLSIAASHLLMTPSSWCCLISSHLWLIAVLLISD